MDGCANIEAFQSMPYIKILLKQKLHEIFKMEHREKETKQHFRH